VPFGVQPQGAKDHGEGGTVVGAKLQGRVLIVDDVISAGTSVRESADLIRNSGAEPAGVVIALDRMERGSGEKSAVQEVREQYGIPVVAVVTLDNLVEFLERDADRQQELQAVAGYRATVWRFSAAGSRLAAGRWTAQATIVPVGGWQWPRAVQRYAADDLSAKWRCRDEQAGQRHPAHAITGGAQGGGRAPGRAEADPA